MKYYIDGNWQPGNYFWAAVQGIATEGQRARLLDGEMVWIGGETI